MNSSTSHLQLLTRTRQNILDGLWGKDAAQRARTASISPHQQVERYMKEAIRTPVSSMLWQRTYPLLESMVATFWAVYGQDEQLAFEYLSCGLNAPESELCQSAQRKNVELRQRAFFYERVGAQTDYSGSWRLEVIVTGKSLLQAYHELLGLITAYKLLCWRTARGDKVKRSALKNFYGSVCTELGAYASRHQLSPALEWLTFCDVDFRNALAHHDSDFHLVDKKIHYEQKDGTAMEMDFGEFVMQCSVALQFLKIWELGVNVICMMLQGDPWLQESGLKALIPLGINAYKTYAPTEKITQIEQQLAAK